MTILDIGRAVGYYAVKALYPVLGNLSAGVKQGLERRLGDGCFDAREATEVSAWVNGAIYPTLAGWGAISHMAGDDVRRATPAIIGALLYAAVEGFVRCDTRRDLRFERRSYLEPDPSQPILEISDGDLASLPGKAVSLPIDALLSLRRKMEEFAGSQRYAHVGDN